MITTIFIDHLILEKYRDEAGVEYMLITRFSNKGDKLPGIEFKMGDKDTAYKFLDSLAVLFGVK